MSFKSFDIKGLANLLRQSDPNHLDSDDSEDENNLATTTGSSQNKTGRVFLLNHADNACIKIRFHIQPIFYFQLSQNSF